jgi:hypothetical protein
VSPIFWLDRMHPYITGQVTITITFKGRITTQLPHKILCNAGQIKTNTIIRVELQVSITVYLIVLVFLHIFPACTPEINMPLPIAAEARTYTNPIFRGDFPDPFVLPVEDHFYAYATMRME